MAAIMLVEFRKNTPERRLRRHRQVKFWNHGQVGRIRHLDECPACMKWRVAIAVERMDWMK